MSQAKDMEQIKTEIQKNVIKLLMLHFSSMDSQLFFLTLESLKDANSTLIHVFFTDFNIPVILSQLEEYFSELIIDFTRSKYYPTPEYTGAVTRRMARKRKVYLANILQTEELKKNQEKVKFLRAYVDFLNEKIENEKIKNVPDQLRISSDASDGSNPSTFYGRDFIKSLVVWGWETIGDKIYGQAQRERPTDEDKNMVGNTLDLIFSTLSLPGGVSDTVKGRLKDRFVKDRKFDQILSLLNKPELLAGTDDELNAIKKTLEDRIISVEDPVAAPPGGGNAGAETESGIVGKTLGMARKNLGMASTFLKENALKPGKTLGMASTFLKENALNPLMRYVKKNAITLYDQQRLKLYKKLKVDIKQIEKEIENLYDLYQKATTKEAEEALAPNFADVFASIDTPQKASVVRIYIKHLLRKKYNPDPKRQSTKKTVTFKNYPIDEEKIQRFEKRMKPFLNTSLYQILDQMNTQPTLALKSTGLGRVPVTEDV
jgi:hypothetical protein